MNTAFVFLGSLYTILAARAGPYIDSYKNMTAEPIIDNMYTLSDKIVHDKVVLSTSAILLILTLAEEYVKAQQQRELAAAAAVAVAEHPILRRSTRLRR